MPVVDVKTLRKRRHATLARLARVNRAITRLDEYEAAANMPAELRPDVRKPLLGRDALESLREMLEGELKLMEYGMGRRN